MTETGVAVLDMRSGALALWQGRRPFVADPLIELPQLVASPQPSPPSPLRALWAASPAHAALSNTAKTDSGGPQQQLAAEFDRTQQAIAPLSAFNKYVRQGTRGVNPSPPGVT